MKSDEFPEGASEWPEDFSRREFLRLTGASLALAGLGACTKQPVEKIVPYVKQPEGIVPGKPLHFATATTFNGYAQGIVVTSREGLGIAGERMFAVQSLAMPAAGDESIEAVRGAESDQERT